MEKNAVTTIIPTPVFAKRVFLILCGSVLMAVNLRTFVYAGGLFPGGFSGVSLLVQRAAHKYFNLNLPYSALYLLMNAVPVYISFRFIGKRFTIFSLVMIAVSSFLADAIPVYQVTDDLMLNSVFGGLINGISIVLCLWADATSGGTDFIAIFFAIKKGRDVWNEIFIGNCCVLVLAGILFGWESALYSIIFQFASTQVLNILYQRYKKSTVFIVTEKPDEICTSIYAETHHDATKIDARGAYKNGEKTIVYTVISSDQVKHLSAILRKIDSAAFINVLETKELLGRFFTETPR